MSLPPAAGEGTSSESLWLAAGTQVTGRVLTRAVVESQETIINAINRVNERLGRLTNVLIPINGSIKDLKK